MQKSAKFFIALGLLFALCFVYTSCGDEGFTVGEEETLITFPEPTELLMTSFYGSVVNKGDDPIEGATVTCNSCVPIQSTITDETGNFIFKEILNAGNTAFVKVSYPSMFEGFRRLGLREGRYNYTEIKLKEKNLAGTIDAGTGGVLTEANGSGVTLPANGIKDAQGNPYNGSVDVYISWIDPSADDLAQNMVGDLSGVDSEGVLMSLSTFGMLVVELQDSEGNELNILEGHEAELKFRVPDELLEHAKETIPLWSYNEEEGYWVEESEARLDGNFFHGNVSHFSAWNVDYKGEAISISGIVGIEANNRSYSASYLEVYVSGPNIGLRGGWLCDDGSFLFYNFPADQEFTMMIKNICGDVIHQEVLGPFGTDTELDPIIVNGDQIAEEFVVITGNAVDCKHEAISNGAASLTLNSKGYLIDSNADGSFQYATSICLPFSGDVKFTDFDSFNTSEKISFDDQSASFEFNDIEVCNQTDEYFYMKIDGYYEELVVRTSDTNVGIIPDGYGLIGKGFTYISVINNLRFFINFDPERVVVDEPLYGDKTQRIYAAYLDNTGAVIPIEGTMEGIEILFSAFDLGNGDPGQALAIGEMSGFFEDSQGVRYDVTGSFNILPQ